MKRGYVYKRPVKKSHYSNFRRNLIVTLIFLIAIGGIAYFIYTGLHHQPANSAISKAEITEITGNKKTFTNDYFEFKDTGDWVLDKDSTKPDRIVYHKFRKNDQQHELIVYINQVPIPLYLATQRALPVRIVNNNSFQVTNVSNPCGSLYAKGEPHKVKEMVVNNTTMLCDPDAQQYFVVIGEVNGNYVLNLKRSNGTPIQFIITYKDTGADAQPDSLLNIASSFKTR
jgi:hypothetical protein